MTGSDQDPPATQALSGGEYSDWLVGTEQMRFDYALTGTVFALLMASVGLSTRLGFSYPGLLIAAWNLLGLAGLIGIFRIRGGIALQRQRLSAVDAPGLARGTRHERAFWLQMLCLFLGLALNTAFLSFNLWLDNIDQQQNGAGYEDGATCQTKA